MAVDTYTNLKAEIADWLNRQDLTSQIPTFVRLLEAQCERTLKTREMLALDTDTTVGGEITLPDDFLGVHELYVDTANGPKSMEYAPLGEIQRAKLQRSDVAGEPRLYHVLASTIVLAPEPDAEYDYTLSYYQKIPALTTTTQETNWLLDRHPDLYLYGSLLQAAPYLHGDERIATWGTAMAGILEQIGVVDERERRGSSPLRARFKPYGGRR